MIFDIELDHLFIWTTSGAPEADCLRDFGLVEGSANRHPGQGTACRRFFFHNAMLELLWVEDEKEARSDAILPTRLWERWSKRRAGASPFGICFRPVGPATSSAPFPAWDFRPPYIPAGHSIQMAADTPLNEPVWFYLGFSRRPDSAPPGQRQPLDHPRGLGEVTRVTLTIPEVATPSDTARLVGQLGSLSIIRGSEPLLELGFDRESSDRQKDFRPNLPVVFRW